MSVASCVNVVGLVMSRNHFSLQTKRLNYALNNIVSTRGPIIDSSPYCGRFHYAAQIPDPF